MVELLFWPALLAYGEAAVAYVGDARRPGLAGRLAIWGVRVGWLVQTALLVAQAVRADGFAWASWGGSLNLFVWLVVGAYLIWGCRPRYRLLGLAVLPLAFVLLLLARVVGIDATSSDYSTYFLVTHVGLVLVAFAGFTLAAALAGLYLWQERRLKRRATTIFRRAVPPLARLDELSARTIAVALPALTLGIVIGVARLAEEDAAFDALMGLTVLTWAVYALALTMRYVAGWRGRRAAYLVIAGFLLVAIVRLALPLTHFAA